MESLRVPWALWVRSRLPSAGYPLASADEPDTSPTHCHRLALRCRDPAARFHCAATPLVALTTLQSPVPHDPVAGHVQVCELCLQLAGADAALPLATLAIGHDTSDGIDSGAAALPRRVEAFVAYAARAPPQRS
jgi:hypothetical protein